MTTIKIDGLQKKYGKFTAVENSTLQFESGQFVVFLGPSGCGKTTTLNCLAGFELPTNGRIIFDDVDVTDLPPHTRNVAMVFQSALLYPHLSAQDNIEMSLKHSDLSEAEKKTRISETTTMLRVDHLMSKRPGALSGGERQRVALAKAIVRQPSVFLMDEPFSALDAALRNSLRAELVHLQKKLGVTTIFVTHDQIEAMTMGDIIVVMNKGKVEQVGTPDEIYNNPQTKFVAGFIGSPAMNFFEGVLAQDGKQHYLKTGSADIALPAKLLAKHSEIGKSYALGVRPQHVKIVDKAGKDTLAMEVYAVERHGKENVVILQDPHGAIYRLLSDPGVDAAVGSKLMVGLDLSHGYLFPQ